MKKKVKANAPCLLPAKEELLDAIRAQKRPLRIDALLRILRIPRQGKKQLLAILDELSRDGSLIRLPGGLWSPTGSLRTVSGTFLSLERGGVVIPPGGGRQDEIHIPPQHVGEAWNKDFVSVVLCPGSHGKQGKIVQVLERRARDIAVRVMRRDGKSLLCRPVDRHLRVQFSILQDHADPLWPSIRPGMLLTVRPAQPLAADLWSATILNVYGDEDKISVQEALVKTGHKVPREFPALALRQAASLPDAPEDVSGREDLRALPFVTIDGADARDFDDAVHVERQGAGWLLRVAIADVSHYVQPDPRPDSLDGESFRRGNSWYFPRSVEPMLPQKLSNGLCSLRPGEDRLGLLAEVPFSEAGEPGRPRFAAIVLRSAARLVYDDVARLFASGFADSSSAIDERLRPMLAQAFQLYKKLARRRRQRGSLDFDLPEPAYSFDAEGRLLQMSFAERNDAHRLIEEFMIAANEAVAEYLGSRRIPFLYRVHPRPEPLKLQNLFETLRLIAGEFLPAGLRPEDLADPLKLQGILNRARGSSLEYQLNRICLRAMTQARYQPVNDGHFGLASPAYCHFTSPIRRYADLLTHRALKFALGLSQNVERDREALARIGDQLNKLEREAMECEREMAKRLACLALKPHEGETFQGVISGLTDFGIFVELDQIPAEGMIRLESLGQDWFELDQKRQQIVGRHTGQSWRLGQALAVRIVSVDTDMLETRLEPVGKTRKTDSRKGGRDSKRPRMQPRKKSPRRQGR